ncbi:shikimate dehydrogenase [Inhella inkyongensis]|uniref:Shikimate dehydrogenase (NADP(+)) n=1 Tax=Inhella inkyongensis TaxID=392593 RepID=A0A840S151_9BURK|nr:shikimate dehydrogenase [Inhella inkyongensis]MBB5203493.1 shikimate dehydrogenase [Inhella inkyongensis]
MRTPPFYAVIGQPIAHSRSPQIHQAFAAQFGMRLRYEACAAPLDGFAATLQTLRAQGLRGCNVTLPFKGEALGLAEQMSDAARLAGAANTLGWDEQGRLWADNTDGAGLLRDLRRHLDLQGRRVLMLGAGGAVAGCLAPLMQAGVASIHLSNRSAEKVAPLIQRHAALPCPLHSLAWGSGEGAGFDLVINGTSAGLSGAGLTLPTGLLAPGAWAVDLVYGPAAQPFLQAAQAQGARTLDGLGMLVEQAALAFERWHGLQPQTPPVLDALRRSLE